MVVFPIGIPGMGKTHFAETTLLKVFQEMGTSPDNLHIIQNDYIRKKSLDNWLKKNPRKTVKEGIKATS